MADAMVDLQVIDLFGREIATESKQLVNGVLDLDMSSLAAGNYLLRLWSVTEHGRVNMGNEPLILCP